MKYIYFLVSQGISAGTGADGSPDALGDRSDEDGETKGEEVKICSNCTVAATVLNDTPKGAQCQTCFNHWK